MTSTIPILILSDGPDQHTGLARIARALAYMLSAIPQLEVGFLGRGTVGKKKFPWVNYASCDHNQWGENIIEDAWMDLAGNKTGIIFTVWDASRLLWFADPVGMPTKLASFLNSGRFQRWGYFMQDSEGPNPGTLPIETSHVLSKYNRVLMASRWACDLARNSMNHPDLDWMPHGLNLETFRPVSGTEIRSAWGIPPDGKLIGCVATNQERKHWPTMIEAVSKIPNAFLWMHTDTLDPRRYWNLPALIEEFGMQGRVVTDDRTLNDSELAMRYSACDATLLISGCEGFAFPVAESLACGVPCVTGSYSAQAELNFSDCLVEPSGYQVVTRHNTRRAVYDADKVAERLAHVLSVPITHCRERVEHLDWKMLGHQWKKWVQKGLPK